MVVTWLWPGMTAETYMYVLVGMGSFLGAATSAPLMAILMIFEMTLSYQIVLPLILACVIAHFVSRAVAEEIGRATSELQSLMRISYAVFCLKTKNNKLLTITNKHTSEYIT